MKFLAVVCPLLLALPALANDTSVTAAAGGIVATKNNAISIRKERLKLSLNEVAVDYEFFNSSDKDVTLDVAFPMPEIHWNNGYASAHDPLYDVYRLLEDNATAKSSQDVVFSFPETVGNGSLKPFENFSLVIDQKKKPYYFRYRTKTASGKDITEKLFQAGVPLSVMYLQGWVEESAFVRVPAFHERISTLKDVEEKDVSKWYNEVLYQWQDKFPAKKTHTVSHRYQPQPGSEWVHSADKVEKLDDVTFTGAMWKWSDYCPSKSLQADLLNRYKKAFGKKEPSGDKKFEPIFQAREIGYVLKTGANWAGPIADFELEVVPPNPNYIISFCWNDEIKQQRDGHVVVRAKTFTPEKDLRVLMLIPHDEFFKELKQK